MSREVMLGLTNQPTKASGKQGLRSFPRGGALSPNFAAFPAFLKACASFPSEMLRVVTVVLEMRREKLFWKSEKRCSAAHLLKFFWKSGLRCSAWGCSVPAP